MKPIFILLLSLASTTVIVAQTTKQGTETKTPVATYVCPMHPDMTSATAGRCSKCNMDLAQSNSREPATDGTEKYVCPMHSDIVRNGPASCTKCKPKMVVERRGSKQSVKVWSCSMHTNSNTAGPATCPKCGMAMEKMNRVKN